MGTSAGKKVKPKNNQNFNETLTGEDIDKLNNNNNKNPTQTTYTYKDFNDKNEIKKEKIVSNKDNNTDINIDNNYIIAEIDIINVNKDIRIINSYEESLRKDCLKKEIKKSYMNENEIKECIIKINDKEVPFNYFFKFDKKGTYTIKYYFKNYLTKTNCMFYGCENIKKLNLSNFYTKNIINMGGMFFGCSSLTDINLTNFNSQNVINMNHMFCKCSSLEKLDLSTFNIGNVKYMMSIFFGCTSLTKLNLFNIDTKNVSNMIWMFYGCVSLKKENIIINDKKILKEFK